MMQQLSSFTGFKWHSMNGKVYIHAFQKWNIGKINHVAIATPDIDKAASMFRDVLGAKVSEKHVSHFPGNEQKNIQHQ